MFLGILGTFSSHDPQLCSEGHTHHLVVSCVGKLRMLWVAGEACPHPAILLRPKPGMLTPPCFIPHTDGELFSPFRLSLSDAERVRSKRTNPKARGLGVSALPALVVKTRAGIRGHCASSPYYRGGHRRLERSRCQGWRPVSSRTRTGPRSSDP